MSKYSEMLALLDYVNKNKAPKTWRRRDYDEDPMDHLLKFKKMADNFKKFTEDMEKINKKDKKGGWEGMSAIQQFTILTALVPMIIAVELIVPAVILVRVLGLHQ